MKNTTLLAVLAGLTFAAGNALAAADGAKLYQEKTCVACHGKDAKKPLTPEYPKRLMKMTVLSVTCVTSHGPMPPSSLSPTSIGLACVIGLRSVL